MNPEQLTSFDRAMIALAARRAADRGQRVNLNRVALQTMYRAGSTATTARRIFVSLGVWS